MKKLRHDINSLNGVQQPKTKSLVITSQCQLVFIATQLLSWFNRLILLRKEKAVFWNCPITRSKSLGCTSTPVERKPDVRETIFKCWLLIVSIEIVEFRLSLKSCRKIINRDSFFFKPQTGFPNYGFSFNPVHTML